MTDKAAPTMKGRFVMDRDGDVWQQLSGGALWRCLTTESVDTYGGDLLNVCGPLDDLGPVEAVRVATRQETLRDTADELDHLVAIAVPEAPIKVKVADWLRAQAGAL